MIPMIKL